MDIFFAVIDVIIRIFLLALTLVAVIFMAAVCVLSGWTMWKGYHLWEDLKKEMGIDEKLPHIKVHLTHKLDEMLHARHL